MNRQPKGPRTAETLARLLGAGWHVALSIAGGTALGFWLDGRWDTTPLFTLLGLALGIVVAFFGLFRILRDLWKTDGQD
ncbi:MAG: AtpZ/AtpI family protein [Chloroflexota bacterium]